MEMNDDGLGIYEKYYEISLDYCISLKSVEENIKSQYNNLQYNSRKYLFKAFLIEMKDYNKFKEQIEYNTFINDIGSYKDTMIMKLVSQVSENINYNINYLNKKLKPTFVNSIKELYQLLNQGHEYILINAQLGEKIIENTYEGIYSYSLDFKELILNINGENLHFLHNKNIINLSVLKAKEKGNFQNIKSNNILDDYESLIDWLVKFIIAEEDFKMQLKSRDKKKDRSLGYLIDYNTYQNWEKIIQIHPLGRVVRQFLSQDKKFLTNEEKQQVINILKNNNISKKNLIQSLKFYSIEQLIDFNKVNDLILFNKELYILINDENKEQNDENQIEYECFEKSVDIFINNKKSTFVKFDNIISSYLYNNLSFLIKTYFFQKNFFVEKKPSIVYLLNNELLQNYKECFQFIDLIVFLEGCNVSYKKIDEKQIFDLVRDIPSTKINSIKENIKSFKFEIKSIVPEIITTNNNINFAYTNNFDNIFLNGGLLINFWNINSLSKEESLNLRRVTKFFFIKDKILILFEHEMNSFGQIGNINKSDNEISFDIDYLISVKEKKTVNKGTALLNDFLKSEDDYNKFYNDIYFSNQNVYFEYKISDKLILNVLNFKKHKTKNIDNNNFSNININNNNLNNEKVYAGNNIYTDNLLANSPNFFYNNINLNNLPNKYINPFFDNNPNIINNQNNEFEINNNSSIYNNQKYISINNNYGYQAKINMEYNEPIFAMNNNDNIDNCLMNQFNDERQKIMRLEKELYLAKQKIKELEDKEEKTIAINFILSEKINYTMKCMSNDIFSNIERIIYNEYPEYKTKNVIFVIKGNIINKNETLEKNGIKNGDSITLIY